MEENELDKQSPELESLPSKSQKKRDALRAIDLARELATLSTRKRDKLGLSAEVSEGLKVLDGIKSNNARKRQTLFIGKLLRASEDYELIWRKLEQPAPTQQDSSSQVSTDNAKHEAMCNRLITDLAGTMDELRAQYPHANIQLIRQLVSRIHKSDGLQGVGTTKEEADNENEKEKEPQAKLMRALLSALQEGAIQ